MEEFKAGEVKWEASCSWTSVKSMELEKTTQREKIKSEKEGCVRTVENPDIYRPREEIERKNGPL